MPGTRKECVLGTFLLIFRAAEQAGSATFSRTGLLEAHRGLFPVPPCYISFSLSVITSRIASFSSTRNIRL